MTKKKETPELWTPQQVADALNISIKTVYKHAVKMGGFYPFGIGRLRFDGEKIQAHLVCQRQRSMAIRVPIQGSEISGSGGISNRKTSRARRTRSQGPAPIRIQEGREDRHDLKKYFDEAS